MWDGGYTLGREPQSYPPGRGRERGVYQEPFLAPYHGPQSKARVNGPKTTTLRSRWYVHCFV